MNRVYPIIGKPGEFAMHPKVRAVVCEDRFHRGADFWEERLREVDEEMMSHEYPVRAEWRTVAIEPVRR